MRRTAAMLLVMAACSPVTTRPDFRPVPQATQLLLVGDPAAVTRHAAAWIGTAGIPTVRVSEVDRYIETDWYTPPPDSGTAQPFPFRVKTRLWVDPGGSGRARAVIETVYRPVEDPSRAARDREIAVPPDAGADLFARRLAAAIREKFAVL
jgi:hypothetical protein